MVVSDPVWSLPHANLYTYQAQVVAPHPSLAGTFPTASLAALLIPIAMTLLSWSLDWRPDHHHHTTPTNICTVASSMASFTQCKRMQGDGYFVSTSWSGQLLTRVALEWVCGYFVKWDMDHCCRRNVSMSGVVWCAIADCTTTRKPGMPLCSWLLCFLPLQSHKKTTI